MNGKSYPQGENTDPARAELREMIMGLRHFLEEEKEMGRKGWPQTTAVRPAKAQPVAVKPWAGEIDVHRRSPRPG